MEKGDPVPANLPSENTLRVIKCRNGASSTSKFPKDALWSLVELKAVFYPTGIREISIYPFCVRYALPMQKEFYSMATKRKRSGISIDATGFNIRTNSFLPQTGEEKKMPVFLYTIGCHSGGKTMPVYQVLSNKHTLSFHVGWLTEWAKNNKIPDEITLDDSAALVGARVGACLQAFAKLRNTNQYISHSMDSLLLGASPPPIFIRLDRSHFVKSLHRLEVLNREHVRIRIFVKRLFGFLILCDSLEVVKTIIQNLFTVLRCEFATKSCTQSLEFLKEICASDDPNAAKNTNEEHTFDEMGDFEEGTKSGHTFQLKDTDDSYKGTTTYK